MIRGMPLRCAQGDSLWSDFSGPPTRWPVRLSARCGGWVWGCGTVAKTADAKPLSGSYSESRNFMVQNGLTKP
jgi:hypothetical protein